MGKKGKWPEGSLVGAAGRGLATPLICRTRTCPILYRKNNIFNLCFQLFIKLTCAIDINSFYSAVTSYKLDNNFNLPSQLPHDTWQQQGGVRIKLTLPCIIASCHEEMKCTFYSSGTSVSTYLFSNISSWYTTLLHLGFYIC